MGQSTSKNTPYISGPPIFDEDISIRRRRRQKRGNSCRISVASVSGMESGCNIDNILCNMGVTAELEESPFSDSSCVDEISPIVDHRETRKKVHELYDMRLNRYKARLSAMYPEHSTGGDINITKLRSSSMMELVSFLDVSTQLNLKRLSRYFRKLVKISHNCVSLDAASGWIDAIHLSTFLKSITLVGNPKEADLKEFTALLGNDGFMQLNTLCLYLVGECALIEILSALGSRIQREVKIGILTSEFQAQLIIQENEFSPYFASKFATICNSSLYNVLSYLTLITNESDGVELILRDTHLSLCSRLKEVDLSGVPLGRRGFELLWRSLWPIDEDSVNKVETTLPLLTILRLSDTSLTDSCLVCIATTAERGLLTNITKLDLSRNNLRSEGMHALMAPLSHFLCPNLSVLRLSGNKNIGCGALTPWILSLASGVCPLLHELELNACNLTAEEMDALGVYFNSPFVDSMTKLDVGNNIGTSSALQQFFQCMYNSTCHNLHSLNFEGLNVSSSMLEGLSAWLRTEKSVLLDSLVLRVNLIDEGGLILLLVSLVSIRRHSLTLLDLSSNILGNFVKAKWDKLIEGSPITSTPLVLKEMDISHNPCNNADMDCIISFVRQFLDISSLHRVSFDDNNITGKGMAAFFKMFPTDVICDLRTLSVTSLSLRGIGKSLHDWLCTPAASHLHKLQLVNCNLGRKDLTWFIHAFEVSEYSHGLNTLKLSGNGEINDDFVTDFLRIYDEDGILPVIYNLDLSYTSVTKVGAYAILHWIQSHEDYSIRMINMSYTKLSQHRVRVLHDEFRRDFKGGCLM